MSVLPILQTMKVKLQPPSGAELAPFNPILPPAAVTQVMLLANPLKVERFFGLHTFINVLSNVLIDRVLSYFSSVLPMFKFIQYSTVLPLLTVLHASQYALRIYWSLTLTLHEICVPASQWELPSWVCACVCILQEKVRMRYKLTFTLGEQPHTEVGEVNEFPPADRWGAL